MKYLIIILILLFSCSSREPVSLRKPASPSQQINTNSILNYEDSAVHMHNFNLNTHFEIRIKIETINKPFIVKKIKLTHIKRIYRLNRVEGFTIFHAHVNTKGQITSHSIVKTAGLGLDKLAEQALKNIKLSPVFSAGKKYNSKVYVRIGIKGINKL